MNFIEFLGFVVSLLAMFYLFVKQALDQKRRRANPEEYEREVEEKEMLLRKLMHGEVVNPHRSISTSVKKSHPQHHVTKISRNASRTKNISAKPPVAPPLKKIKAIDPYALKQTQGPSPIERALGRLDSKKELVILSEIYGPPKGLQ